jgi:hypothetical protein
MKECAERVIKIGFRKNPKKICDEIERVSAEMIRDGWHLRDTCVEDGLGCAHLFFERGVDISDSTGQT